MTSGERLPIADAYRRHCDFVQDAVDPVADPQIVFERFHVDASRVKDSFANDLVHELHHRRLDRSMSVVAVSMSCTPSNDRFVLRIFVERFCADAVNGLHRAQDLARHQHHSVGFRFYCDELRRPC